MQLTESMTFYKDIDKILLSIKNLRPGEIAELAVSFTDHIWNENFQFCNSHSDQINKIENIAWNIFELFKNENISETYYLLNMEYKNKCVLFFQKLFSNKICKNKFKPSEFVSVVRAIDDLSYKFDTKKDEKKDKISFWSPSLYNVINKKFIENCDNFNSDQLVWIAYALRKISSKDLNKKNQIILYNSLNKFKIECCSTKSLSIIPRAFTQSGQKNVDIFYSLSIQIVEKIASFTGSDLYNIIWAYAYNKLDEREMYSTSLFNEKFLPTIKDAVLAKMEELNPKELSQTAWSFVELCYLDTELEQAFINQIYKIGCNKFTAAELATTIKALCEMGYKNELIYRDLFSQIQKSDCSIQDYIKIASGLMIPYCLDVNLDEEIIFLLKLASNNYEYEFAEAEISVIYTLSTIYALKSDKSIFLSENLCKKMDFYLISMKEKEIQMEKKNASSSSQFHKNVYFYLEKIDENFKMERFFHGYMLDIAHKDLRLAIEVDGRCHFIIGTQTYMPRNKIKEVMLALWGWKLIRIPYFEWDPLRPWNVDGKKEYLLNKLKEIEPIIKTDVEKLASDSEDSSSYRNENIMI